MSLDLAGDRARLDAPYRSDENTRSPRPFYEDGCGDSSAEAGETAADREVWPWWARVPIERIGLVVLDLDGTPVAKPKNGG